MIGRVFGLLLLTVACKETPTGGGSPDVGGRSSLAGTWAGVQSVNPNGPGNLAKLQLDTAPGGQVSGVLHISRGMPTTSAASEHWRVRLRAGIFRAARSSPTAGSKRDTC